MHFSDKLIRAIEKKGTPICLGLDPYFDRIPHVVRSAYPNDEMGRAEAVGHFFMDILDAVHDIVPVVKLQLAFFEALGPRGIEVFQRLCQYAWSLGLVVLADGKRNDISSTAGAYANAYLGNDAFPVDALTVTPYLGSDGIYPFLEQSKENGRGIFILVKTSNPSSGEFQDLELQSGEKLYERVATSVASWGKPMIGECGFSDVGAVVGATYPEEARILRKLMPHQIFLVPGYGAQGGTVEDIKPCFTEEGKGAIINSSRGILYAFEKSSEHGEDQYADAARSAALTMKDEIAKFD